MATKPNAVPKQKKGFAAETEEKRSARIAKSIATRKRNKAAREEKNNEAGTLREQAEKLIAEGEELLAKADEIDGLLTSKSARARSERVLCDRIDERFKDTVAPQYLKLMKQYALQRKIPADSLVTPTFLAMDILHDMNSSKSDKKEAMKALQSFENAKPQMNTDAEDKSIGSVQDELNNVMEVMNSSGRRE